MARNRTRVTIDGRVWRQIASSPEMAAYMLELANRGKAIAEVLAPTYSGPTWGSEVRAQDYKRSLEAKVVRNSFGWRGEIAANVPYAVQVEFGTGRPWTSQERPQEGYSPKWRVLGRTLEAMRN
jgi:hypothetical protein